MSYVLGMVSGVMFVIVLLAAQSLGRSSGLSFRLQELYSKTRSNTSGGLSIQNLVPSEIDRLRISAECITSLRAMLTLTTSSLLTLVILLMLIFSAPSGNITQSLTQAASLIGFQMNGKDRSSSTESPSLKIHRFNGQATETVPSGPRN